MKDIARNGQQRERVTVADTDGNAASRKLLRWVTMGVLGRGSKDRQQGSEGWGDFDPTSKSCAARKMVAVRNRPGLDECGRNFWH